MKGKGMLLGRPISIGTGFAIWIGAGFAISIGACSRSVAPFDEIDGNHDGRISQQEASHDAVLSERFVKLDADDDGELTPFEYLQYLQASNRL
jgi:hypothetical protein